MGKRDPRVDAYIRRQADFAIPILERLRDLTHEACPDVEETIKWSMPFFQESGALLSHMAGFKRHASYGFWKHALVVGDGAKPRDGEADGTGPEGMGSLGKLASVDDLPAKRQLIALIRKAARLNREGVKVTGARKSAPKPAAVVPDDLAAALAMKKHAKANATFDAFAPSHRREYIEWITQAKREDTRARRLAQTLEWLAEGKARNWKYEAC